MNARVWIAVAVLLLAGCGSSRHGSASQTAGSSQSPAATATAPQQPAAAHSSQQRRKPVSRQRASSKHSRPGRSRSAAVTTTAAHSPAPASKRPAGGGGGASQASGPTTVTLVLHGGGNAAIPACGAEHHYRTYARGTPVVFSGTVRPVPSGTWKVKLKIKVCSGGSFGDFVKIDATRDKHHGTFTGSFPAPATGLYEARAELYLGDSDVAKSDKRHFASR